MLRQRLLRFFLRVIDRFDNQVFQLFSVLGVDNLGRKFTT